MVSLLEAPKPRLSSTASGRLTCWSTGREFCAGQRLLDHQDASTTRIDTYVLNGDPAAVRGPAPWMFCRDGEQAGGNCRESAS